MRDILTYLLLLGCVLLVGCAGDTYAPVSDRGGAGSGGSYEVVRGDTLYSIAFRQGLDHRDLAAWNGITSPFTIYPGQTLRLAPAGRETASRSSPSPAPSPERQPTRAATPPESAGPESARRAPAQARAESRVAWQWPTGGDVLKSFSADGDGKQGITIGGVEGEDVKAAASGRVVYSGSGLAGYGNLVILKHEEDYLTAYGYNSVLLVVEGSDVRQGQAIAKMGLNRNRPMLHFELRRSGRAVDPLPYLPSKP